MLKPCGVPAERCQAAAPKFLFVRVSLSAGFCISAHTPHKACVLDTTHSVYRYHSKAPQNVHIIFCMIYREQHTCERETGVSGKAFPSCFYSTMYFRAKTTRNTITQLDFSPRNPQLLSSFLTRLGYLYFAKSASLAINQHPGTT